MTGIELYSKTASSNNSAVPNGWPEGMAPSGVNDAARQMMAAIRTWYEDAEWTNWGDTTVYVASTQFKIAGSDVTTRYSVGRRVRAVGSSTGTIYGIITVSSFSTDTTITVTWDSGSLSNETLTISIATIKGGSSKRSIDASGISGISGIYAPLVSPSFTTPVLGAATGTSLNLSGLTASQLTQTDASKNLVSSNTLPSGTIATTQAANDSSTKVATTAYVNPANSIGAAGYQQLASGLIIQWGISGNVSAGGSSAISFSTTFSTATYSITITQAGSTTNPQAASYIDTVSTSGFTIHNQGISGNVPFYWMAIGK